VSAGFEVAAANLGLLTFVPAADANGNNYASFSFQVRDNGGTANGGVDLDPTPNTISFNVTPVNDAPAGTDNTVTIVEDSVKTFTAADFGFSDSIDGHSLAAVKISSLPTNGTLRYNGTTITQMQVNAGFEVAAANLGLLTFVPVADANGEGYASFTFQVRDNGGTANGGVDLDPTPNTISFNVTPVNDLPTVVASSATVPTLTVDETDFATDASASFASVFTSSFGGDGFKDSNSDGLPDADAITYALGINTGATGLVDQQTNAAVVLSLESGAVIGRAGTAGPEVFRITVDTNSGLVTLDQKRSVVHNSPNDPDEAAGLSVANLVTLTATIRDRDLSSASTTRNIGTAFRFKDDGPTVSTISNLYSYNTDQPLNGVYNLNVGADVVGNAATNGIMLQSFSGITARGGTTPNGRSITDQTLTWSNETDSLVTYNFSFKYFAQPTSTRQQTATGTVSFNKSNGTYTFDLADAINDQVGFSTSLPQATFNHDTQDNNSPEIVVQQYTSNFFGVLNASAGPSGQASGLITVARPGASLSDVQINDRVFQLGELLQNTFTAYLNVSNDTVGVNSDTIQEDELVNYDFYIQNPVVGSGSLAMVDPGATRAYVDTVSITLDQITALGGVAQEDIAILLKLYNRASNTYTTKLLIANNAADYKQVGNYFQVDVNKQHYADLGADHQIYGVQIVASTDQLEGIGYSLTGNNPVTITAAGSGLEDTADNDVIKIIKIDTTTRTLPTFDTTLNFAGRLVDGDGDAANLNFAVNLQANGSSLIGTAQSDYLTGSSSADIINGGAGNDFLFGFDGNDQLTGGLGSDQLTGGLGNDQFIFNSLSEGIDTITDFTRTGDRIVVSKSGFGAGLSSNTVGGAINSNQFIASTSDVPGSAMTSSTRFIYNTLTGGLFYDADGSGAAAAVQFATLSSRPSITSQNIFVGA
jgi:Ca2+-binding RTX toxin-like protein